MLTAAVLTQPIWWLAAFWSRVFSAGTTRLLYSSFSRPAYTLLIRLVRVHERERKRQEIERERKHNTFLKCMLGTVTLPLWSHMKGMDIEEA